MAILEGAGNVPQQAFVQYNDPKGTKLIALNRDGTIYTQGIDFPDGTVLSTASELSSIPIVQAGLDVLDTTTVHNVSLVATRTTMYTISVFLESEGDGLSTDTVVGTLTFEEDDPTDAHTITCTLHGGAGIENIVFETYPMLCEVGTTITFSTAFSASVFTYDLSVRIVQMP